MKKKLLAAVLSAVMLCGCGEQSAGGSTGSTQQIQSESKQESSVSEEPKEDSPELKEKTVELVSEIEKASVLLSNMGNYLGSYWKTLDSINGTFKPKDAVDKAKKWLAEKSETTETKVDDDFKAIVKKNNELLSLDVVSAESKATAEKVSALYEDYCGFYTLVTNPGGSLDDYISKFNDYVESITKSLNILKITLEIDE